MSPTNFLRSPVADTACGPSEPVYGNTFSADYSEDGFELDLDSDEDVYDEEEYDMDPHVQANAHQDPGFGQERYLADTHIEEVEEREYVQLDDDDELEDDEAEVEVVQDSLRESSIEVIYPPRTFTVPDSDDSDAPSYISSREESVLESPTSSQVDIDDGYELKEVEAAHDLPNEDTGAQTSAAAEATAGAPAEAPHDILDNQQSNGEMQPQAETCAVRAPSPSDAAMAKPTSEHPMAAPPFIQTTQHDDGIARADKAVEFERSPSAWAGHNSVLYDNLSNVYQARGPSPTAAIHSFGPPYYDSPYLGNEHPWSEAESYYGVTLPPLQPLSATVVPASTNTVVESSSLSLKRKADLITSDDCSWMFSRSPDLSSQQVETSMPTQTADTEAIEDAHSPHKEADVPMQSTEVEMPPRKKARKSKQRSSERRDNTGGGFLKIAAATVAGMAIGTVGTIIGLASLPPIA